MTEKLRDKHHLSFYRIFRLYFLAVTVSVFLIRFFFGQASLSQWPLFVWMLFPALTPFLHYGIFRDDKPHYMQVHLSLIVFFMGVGLIIEPTSAWIIIALAVIGAIALYFQTKPPSEIVLEEISAERETPPVDVEVSLSLKEQILSRMDNLTKEQQEFDRKAEQIRELLVKNTHYLEKVKSRLKEDYLNDDTRYTSEKLKDSLETQHQNYQLLIQFFSKAASRYSKAEKNLKAQLENLEIISFLNQNKDVKDLAEVEQTLLDIQFEKDIHRILSELNLEDEIPLNFQGDVPMDLRTELKAAIDQLD